MRLLTIVVVVVVLVVAGSGGSFPNDEPAESADPVPSFEFATAPDIAVPQLVAEDGRTVPPPVSASELSVPEETELLAKDQKLALLVKRPGGMSASEFKQQLSYAGIAEAEGLLVPNWWRVPIPDGKTPEEMTRRLRQIQDVDLVEMDRHLYASMTPNDPYYSIGYQWSLGKIGAPAAWDVSIGSSNVIIAVVDSGIDYTHPDKPSSLLLGWDFANNDNNPYDDNGHGTHVAGIAAAATNNDVGVAGVCPGCKIFAVKVLAGDGRGLSSDVADGIAYAAYYSPYYGTRTIINLSLGSQTYSSIIADAVSYAQSRGALVVAASGNEYPTYTYPGYPAALPDVLAVSASTPYDAPAPYSQYGLIAAPGGDGSPYDLQDILSTVPTWMAFPPYQWLAGTSMAAPHVSGVAGLLWALFPSCTENQVSAELINSVDVPPNWNRNWGYGRLNADGALLRIITASLPPGQVGSPYYLTIAARGGTAPTFFSVTSGNLPPGITLSSTGVLEGTPTQTGSYTFTITGRDNICETASRTYNISIGVSTPTPTSYRLYLPVIQKNFSLP